MFSRDVSAESRFISIWRVILPFASAVNALLQQMSPRISLCGVNRLALCFLSGSLVRHIALLAEIQRSRWKPRWRFELHDVIVVFISLIGVHQQAALRLKHAGEVYFNIKQIQSSFHKIFIWSSSMSRPSRWSVSGSCLACRHLTRPHFLGLLSK